MLKVILAKLMATLGWKKVLLYVWEAADDYLKAEAAKTATTLDDEAIKYVDIGIRAICAE